MHNVPRTSKFVPSECDDCPVDLALLTDDRTTEPFYRNSKTKEHDSWRFRGNSVGQGEEWIGTTMFRVLTEDTKDVTNKNAVGYQQNKGCTQAWALSVIPQSNMFVPQSIQNMTNESPVGRKPVVHLILQRQSGRSNRYQFELRLQEIKKMVAKGKTPDHCVILHEMERNVPSLVLMCGEEQNWFTFLQTAMTMKNQYMNVITITEDDDATSSYGRSKAKACLRSELKACLRSELDHALEVQPGTV